jgi:hypothetical protein
MDKAERDRMGFDIIHEKGFTRREAIFAQFNTAQNEATWIQVPSQWLETLRGRAMRPPPAFMQRTVGALTRTYGFLVTQAYPIFAPINMVRDLQERLGYLFAQNITGPDGKNIKQRKLVSDALWFASRNIPQIVTAGAKLGYSHSFKRGEVGDLLRSLAEHGGLSMFRNQFDIAFGAIADEVKSRTRLKGPQRRALARLIAGYNTAFDIVAPLSAFYALTRQGLPDARAASAVLDAMNFYKQGNYTGYTALLYPFARASFVGGNTLIRTLFNQRTGKPNPRGVAMTGAMFVAFATLWAMSAGMDDDEELPGVLGSHNATADGNILIPTGDSYTALPLGYGVSRIANIMARELVKFSYGMSDPQDIIATAMVNGFVPQMTPIDLPPISFRDNPMLALTEMFAPDWFLKPFLASLGKGVYGDDLKPPHKNPNFISSARISPEYDDVARDLRNWTGMSTITGAGIQQTLSALMPGLAYEAMDSLLFNNTEHRKMAGLSINKPLVGRIIKEKNPNAWSAPTAMIYHRTRKVLQANPDANISAADRWLVEQYNSKVSPLYAQLNNKAIGKLSREQQYAAHREMQARRASLTREIYAQYLRRKQEEQ